MRGHSDLLHGKRERDPRVQKQEKRPHATEEEDNHYKSWGKKHRLASASFVPLKNALMFIELPLSDDLFLSYKHTNYYITHIILCALQLRMNL